MEEEITRNPQTQDLAFEGRIWSLRDILPFQQDPLELPLPSLHESLRLLHDACDLWNCKIPINDQDDSYFIKSKQEEDLDILQSTFSKPSMLTSNQTSLDDNRSPSKKSKDMKVGKQVVVGSCPKKAKIIKMPKRILPKRKSNAPGKNGRGSISAQTLMKDLESQETFEKEMSEPPSAV